LDLTPMAGEEVYSRCATVMLEDDGIDAVIVSVVPFTSELTTTAEELKTERRSLADDLPALRKRYNKPLVAVIDAGKMYEPLALLLRQRGIPVFPSCDQAVRSLGRYLCHRVAHKFQPSNRPSDQPTNALQTVA
jgi:acyl-CoA synthetase (NDP forming)